MSTAAAAKRYAIVTGCSVTSIGFLAAKALVSKDFYVVLACRNDNKGKEAEEAIQQENCQYLPCDLGSRESIQSFVQQVKALPEFDTVGLSLLVHNAGVGWGPKTPYLKTKDGVEEIVGVNHLGPFYLTHLLEEDLKRAAAVAAAAESSPPRVVVVSSSLHDPNSTKKKKDDEAQTKELLLPNFPEGIFIDENDKDSYDGAKAYRVSKLCNLWFSYELQRRFNSELGDGKIIVNAISPGFIPTTGLTRRSGWMGTMFLHYVLDPWRHLGVGITRSPEEGAECIVQAATSNTAGNKGGEYVWLPRATSNHTEVTIEAIHSSDESYDEEKGKKVWELSLQVCGLS